MALTPGTRLGVYEVSAKIGEGGMGGLSQARDTALNKAATVWESACAAHGCKNSTSFNPFTVIGAVA